MPKVIGLSGYAQVGKDTVAQVLVQKYSYERVAFADAIRNFLYEVDPVVGFVAGEPLYLTRVVDRDGWEAAKKNPEVRRMLQRTGVAARNQWQKDFWIAQALKKMLPAGPRQYVITDVRFPNEADAIRLLGGEIWRVTRDDAKAVNSHVSESALDNFKFDKVIENNGTIKDLEHLVTSSL